MIPSFIHWSPDVVAFTVFGFQVRWYALCWCLALYLAYFNMHRLYRHQKISDEIFEPIFIYCFLGVLIGARLGHCLFYEPAFYLSHPIEMLLPIHKFPSGWRLVGYEGLSSHGGVLGLFVAIWLYCKHTKMNVMHVLDNMGVITPLSAAFIRLGNLMNSEIVGHPTDMPWGFIFARNGEDFARHPAQLYESLTYLFIFIIFQFVYRKQAHRVGSGYFFGLCLTSIFTFRFFIEFIKADQVAAEADFLINIGQLLSLPLVALGLYCLLGGKYCRKLAEKK